jgi:hypothetical protein
MIVQMVPQHLNQLCMQPAQELFKAIAAQPGYAERLIESGYAYSLVDDDAVFACAGIIPQWANRAIAWALVGQSAGRRMVELHRAVKHSFEIHPFRRIETAVAAEFDEGHRWARLLGFHREGLMRAYTPEGDDCYLYARVVA